MTHEKKGHEDSHISGKKASQGNRGSATEASPVDVEHEVGKIE